MITKEWLETDGLGGFASGTVDGIRTRRYHALLLTATIPPTGRFVLVNGFDAWIENDNGTFAISSQHYTPDVVHPNGFKKIELFTIEPWPTWIYKLEDGTQIEQQIFMKKGWPITVCTWRLVTRPAKGTLSFRPFVSGRDYHSLHHENSAFRFNSKIRGEGVSWHPYADVPEIISHSNATYSHQPLWYRNFLYEEERKRGLDFTEDLGSPGVFRFDLTRGEAIWILSTHALDGSPESLLADLRSGEERRRKQFSGRLEKSASDYIVDRKSGKTIVAGYPWFTDWGRDTFIALRGLCLATGELDIAREILLEWAGTVSQGMLPNRFPDQGGEAEYNSVDASLWYIIAVQDFFSAIEKRKQRITQTEKNVLREAVLAILSGYERGTRYNIHMDEDGLLAAGQPGVQLTWMDAKVGDWVVTPRIGKPVEIQALWLNALAFVARFAQRWKKLFTRGCDSFRKRFWNESGYLYDVIDVDHEPGKMDASFRPNQVFAIGGLPLSLMDGRQARSIIDSVEARLLTPLGLRSLAPGSPNYAPHYAGGPRERDAAYHQGTVWPWLIGPFVEGWLRVHGESAENKQQARTKFLEPLLQHLNEGGLGHISEVADAETPYYPGGCPFQAWSLAEVIRVSKLYL